MITEYIALGLIVLILAWMAYLELRLRKLFLGKKGVDLEDVIGRAISDTKTLFSEKENMEEAIHDIYKRLRTTIRGVEIVRFDAFSDSGGKQSFALALLNEEGNGVVLSSMYARDQVRVFAKPIKNYNSEHELSKEEQQVLKSAKI